MRQRGGRDARTAALCAGGILFRAPTRSTGVIEFVTAFAFAKDRNDLLERGGTRGHLAQQSEQILVRPILPAKTS